MAKKRSTPPASTFRIVGVSVGCHSGTEAAPDGVLELFQQRCRSRTDLLGFLVEYATQHQYLGLPRFSGFNDSLDVSFVDEDSGEYSVGVTFTPVAHLRRDYPDGTYAVATIPMWGPSESPALQWRGSDKPPGLDGERPA